MIIELSPIRIIELTAHIMYHITLISITHRIFYS